MPDITKCKGDGCPHKEHCYRFVAPSSEFRQSWFLHSPIDENNKCDSYWGDRGKEVWKTIPENN